MPEKALQDILYAACLLEKCVSHQLIQSSFMAVQHNMLFLGSFGNPLKAHGDLLGYAEVSCIFLRPAALTGHRDTPVVFLHLSVRLHRELHHCSDPD